ncbi:YARHG domain-containing protein [Pontibacillus salipaludis]|uniref:YARHG domain-containing protein n=1 Tax=Pontibacillus salipaludis TaxID=1697394 RepID=UPI0031EF3790
MKYCKECGIGIAGDIRYCRNCGAEVSKVDGTNVSIHNPTRTNKRRNKPWSFIVIIFTVMLGVGGYVAYQYGASLTSKEKVAEDFLLALEKKDQESLEKFLFLNGEPIQNQDLDGLLALFESEPQLINQVKDQLMSKDGMFSVHKVGKKYLVFDHYGIEVGTYELVIHTNQPETKVSVDGDERGTIDFGEPLAINVTPGIYTVSGERATEFATVVDEGKVTVTGEGESIETSLDVTGDYIEIDANEAKAKLFANGKDTGYQTGDVILFGPVNLDGSTVVWVEKEFSTGLAKSEMIPIRDHSSILFNIEEPQVSGSLTNETSVRSLYLLPNSATQKLSAADIQGWSSYELRLARNEIFARHGYIFQSADLRSYFSSLSWYVPDPNYDGTLSDIEEYNVDFIQDRE